MASCLASSVLPTPVGPVNRKQPAGRSGCDSPARERLMAPVTMWTASSWPNTTRRSDSSSVRRRSLSEAVACLSGMRAIRPTTRSTSAGVTMARAGAVDGGAGGGPGRRVGWRGRRLQSQHRAGLVQDVDGAVGQPVVAQEPLREAGRHFERRVRVVDLVVFLVPRAESLEDPDRLVDRRFLDDHLLQAARQRAVLLDLLELLERRRADDPELAGREHRLDQRRQVHRAARRGAGADRRVDLVDEQDRQRAGSSAPRAPP